MAQPVLLNNRMLEYRMETCRYETVRNQGKLEVVAKITDSMVQDYGCRIRYNKESGEVDLVGEDYCKEVVEEVVNNMRED
jgi:hypothetical protein